MKKLLLLLSFVTVQLFSANFPFPQSVNYPYGIKPNNVSQDTMNQTVLTAFNNWKNAYLTQSGCPQPNMWRVKRPSDGDDTVSEGIGYGMLITVIMTDASDSTKQYFDGLFRYYKNYNDGRNLMHWRIDSSGNVVGYNAATDADEDVALALLFAHRQWGSSGDINYLQEAQTIISALMQHCVESGSYVLKPGDVWGGSSQTNPSYFAPGWYRIFANATGNSAWNSVINKCYDITNYFYNNYNTGLVPDWCQASGAQAGGASYDYKYDACRFPWRYGVEYLWFGTQQAKNHLLKLSNWINSTTGGTASNIKDGYQLNGNVIGSWNNAAFVGPFAVAAMCDSSLQNWLNNLYSRLASFGTESYYNDSLRLLTLLVVTGNFPNLWSLSDSINVYLVTQSSGSIVEGSTNVVINVYTTTTVDRVDFYVDDVLKYTDTSSPYSWSWDTTQYQDGWHQIRVVGYTVSGSSDTKTTSVIVNNVKEPPTIQSATIQIGTNTQQLQNGTTIQGTATITVTATDDIAVTKVEFHVNNVNQYTDTSSPFSFSWNTNSWQDGKYTLTIKVYDTDNLSSQQEFTVYIDNIDSLPSVNITNLQNGTTLQNTVEIQATVSDDKGISKIELYLDNNLIYQQNNSSSISYTIDTTNYPDGSHTIKVVAYDTVNQQATSQITVFFDNIDDPPSVNLLLYDNQIVSGTITINIKYFDDKGISQVEYYLDDQLLSTIITPPYTFTLNTSLYSDGTHKISATVYDTVTQTSSTYVNVIFDNTAPQVAITQPNVYSILKGTAQITFSAQDNNKLDSFQLYINNNLVVQKTLACQTTTYTYTWQTFSEPTTSYIKVVVYDYVGFSVSTQTKVFVDNLAPIINSVSLYNNQIVSGTINITLNALDNLALDKTELYVGNNLVDIVNTYPFVFSLNTTTLNDGRYTFYFKVYDKVNNVSISSVSVIINNSGDVPPTAEIVVLSTYTIVKATVTVNILCQDDKQLSGLILYINDNAVSNLNLSQTTYSYQYNLNTTLYSDGELQIKVKVYDSLTQSTEVAKTIKIDNTPPNINFITPTNGAQVSSKQQINITATDNNEVKFLEMGIYDVTNTEILKISTYSQIIYQIDTKKLQNGIYIIKAKAADIANNLSEKNISIIVSNEDELPSFTITNIEDNQKVKGNLEVKVDFYDDYKVTKIEFYINENLIDTYIANSSTGSHIFTYDSNLLSDGEYILKIVVYDSSNQTTQEFFTFIVDNISDKIFLNLNPNTPANKVVDFGDYVLSYKIYDTKGKLIKEDTSHKWDGKTTNGTFVKPGSYIYCVEKQDKKPNYGIIVVVK